MNNRKIIVLLICLGGLLILSSIVIMVMPEKQVKKEYKELKWNGAFGTPIPTDYDVFTSDDFTTYTYNLDTHDILKKFSVNLPKEIKFESFDINVIKYNIDGIVIDISRTNTKNLKSATETVINTNDPIYEKIYVENAEYDKDVFAIILEFAKYNSDKTSMFFGQEVNIYVRAENQDFAIINMKSYEKRIDKKTISKIVNSIIVDKNKKEFCNKEKCEKEFSDLHESLNGKFVLNVDKNKYVYEYSEGISGTYASYVTKEYAEEDNEDKAIKKLTRIDVRLSYNEDGYLKYLPEQEEVKINGKDILKSYEEKDLEDTKMYKGTYIYKTKNDILIIITIDSRLNNVDKIAKDFLKFNVN